MTTPAANHPAPYALRTWVPVYDDRDAITGRTGYLSKMRYGTVAGALAAMMLEERDLDVDVEVVDTRTGEPPSWREVEAVRTRARKQNPLRYVGLNDKDGIPF
jgi:hypothetical protein